MCNVFCLQRVKDPIRIIQTNTQDNETKTWNSVYFIQNKNSMIVFESSAGWFGEATVQQKLWMDKDMVQTFVV